MTAVNKLARKVEEMRLSYWLEEEMAARYGSKRRAKEEILARYASFVYLGNGRYGFASASDYYFGRPLESLKDTDAADAALLAGITKSPASYAPNADRAASRRRRDAILGLMGRNGVVGTAWARRCQDQPIALARRPEWKTEAPAVIESVFTEMRGQPENAGFEQLLEGRVQVHTTVDARLQRIVNQALEDGLTAYEKRHPEHRGQVQGTVVVLRNADAAILAESGGRQRYRDRQTRYSDLNRVTESRRQPGSAMKPFVYLAGFRAGLMSLDSEVPDEPISVPMGANRPAKWIANYDGKFKGMIAARQALAESRNAVAMWITRSIGIRNVMSVARELGIESALQPYPTTALGASEVNLLELGNAYRAIASGLRARPYVIDRVTAADGEALFRHTSAVRPVDPSLPLAVIQEGLRGVVRLTRGTAHSLDGPGFPIPVMGKTGTTSDFRDALFVGSTYGPEGITVAVRVGFDDNRELGRSETGGRTALPVFRDIVRRAYEQKLVGPVPQFPEVMEDAIASYIEWRQDLYEDAVLTAADTPVAPPPAAVAVPAVFTAAEAGTPMLAAAR